MNYLKNRIWFAAILLTSTSIYAAPVGDPAFPKLLQEGYFIPCSYPVGLRLGYEGDFVGDGRMKQRELGGS